jgi:hypothetical protein
VLCAAKEIFGEKEGTLLLYMVMRYKVNASYLANSASIKQTSSEIKKKNTGFFDDWDAANYRPLNLSELRTLLQGINDYPESIFSISNFKMRRGTQEEASNDVSSTMAHSTGQEPNTITYFHLPMEADDILGAKYVVFHEIAHIISHQKSMAESEEWKKLSGWKSEFRGLGLSPKRIDTFSKPSCMVSEYGKTNANEDFAESISAYRYNPLPLKKNCPEKYNFIRKNVFKGIEYITKESCKA